MRRSLRTSLKGCSRLALLAIGSPLRGDDGAGMLLGRRLMDIRKSTRRGLPVKVFLCGAVPENLTGPVRRFAPSHVLIVDAADMGRRPGSVALIDPQLAAGNLGASTHTLPISVLAGYLQQTIGCRLAVIGIQPENRDYGAKPSRQVVAAVGRLASTIASVLESQAPIARPSRKARSSTRRRNRQ